MDMERGRKGRNMGEVRSTEKKTLFITVKHNMITTVVAKNTLTLSLGGECQGEFGKELIVFKLLLFRLGPETVLREVFRSDLREKER